MTDPGPGLASALRLAGRQDGALSAQQALAVGLTKPEIRGLVARGD